jgi:lipopolysaccharide/colanic/teichoic acid biosynthesis glycosyltransferase
MVRRLCDIVLASAALAALGPVLLVAALGIRLSSRGPVLYRARRAGRQGREFTMYKFRTMHAEPQALSSAITARRDPRVFAFGAWLRRLKVDELPQLINILKGEMSVVGPRPEDPRIVAEHYAPEHYETLTVPPGLASPGSIYNYTHGEKLLGPTDPERDYVERLLPIKLALDLVYVREASPLYDARIVLRTILTIARITLGQREFSDPPEMKTARRLHLAPQFRES